MRDVYVGVDVGTGSARAGLFDRSGRLIATAKHAIEAWREAGDIVEQSSNDIWLACAAALRAAMAEGAVTADRIGGIGFDATCSLVALDDHRQPVTVSPSGDDRRNVIVWMDHRAVEEARVIDRTGDEVLRYVGGSISPEMEMPKLLWLKAHLPEAFGRAAHFLDLADFLSFRATGSLARSICTLTCKWTYLGHEQRWSDGFLTRIGLGEFVEEQYRRIGRDVVLPGTPLGAGLTKEAAAELGLEPGTPVAAGLIDAHAGGVGTVGGRTRDGATADPRRRLGYIMGTSACIMATTASPAFVPGIWGPYYAAMAPGLWLNEGGQTTAGAGIDHIVRAHPAYGAASEAAATAGHSILDHLEAGIVVRSGELSRAALIARDLHVLPDFLGNRSPFADPDVRAAIVGLSLDASIDDLERVFVATLSGIAYGLADVVDAFRAERIGTDAVVVSGGASRSSLVRQILADVTGLTVIQPETEEPVLLGAAMLGAVAGGTYPGLAEAMTAMARDGDASAPTPPDVARFHAAKREVYRRVRELEREARCIMRAVDTG
jgi:D-ribulokinase